jgi:hypothetical protein
MCGHVQATMRGKTVSPDDYVLQVEGIRDRVDFRAHPVVCLYNSGSFLNDREMPPNARLKILRLFASIDGVKKVIVESRPEFITRVKTVAMRDAVGDKTLEVGIGLETSSDEIRSLCINKGFSLGDFERGAAVVKETLTLLTYVLLKPPFLTEREGVEDAIRTVRYALDFGAAAVSLEPVSRQPDTLVERLCKHRLWRLPWLWSVLDVVKTVFPVAKELQREIRIGGSLAGQEFIPRPTETAYNGKGFDLCPYCNKKVKEAIIEYSGTNQLRSLENVSCTCQAYWREELANRAVLPLRDRIKGTMTELRALEGSRQGRAEGGEG